MTRRQIVIVVLVAALAGTSGALLYHLGTRPPASASAAGVEAKELLGQPRPDYRLGSGTGEWVSAANFDGQVVLVNFWATWCAPCREEMPMLAELHRELVDRGLAVVGIALDDVRQAREFAAELGIDYPILVGAIDVMGVARDYGNVTGVLPYSVLIDRAGIIRWVHLGALERKALTREIEALL